MTDIKKEICDYLEDIREELPVVVVKSSWPEHIQEAVVSRFDMKSIMAGSECEPKCEPYGGGCREKGPHTNCAWIYSTCCLA